MRKFSRALTALVLLSTALACRRAPLSPSARDAGRDGGGPSVGDVPPGDILVVDAPADMPADAMADLAGDVPTADATDADAVDTGAVDTGTPDAGLSMCPPGVAPLDVCGCGCCGEAMGRACYYPSRGETRESIPNPIPPPTSCATAGCSFGVRHLCCADPGARSDAEIVCGIDTSVEDWRKFTLTRRIGDTCTTLELGTNAPTLPIAGPPGFAYTNAWRGPCDGSKPPTFAIGGLGQVTPGTTGQLFQFPRYDIHVVVFFDSGTGVAEGVRIDKDDVAVTALCTSNPCPTCTGACALDATYTFTTSGGLAFYRNSTVLAPPVSYVHIQRPEAGTGAEMSCAPPFPACGGDAIDVADVMTAVSDPEVRDAFERSKGAGTTPFYGEDHRGGDGVAFQIQRDDGGGFLIGAACPDPSPRPCMPIPPGLSRLLSLLLALDQQQVAADPTCAFRRP